MTDPDIPTGKPVSKPPSNPGGSFDPGGPIPKADEWKVFFRRAWGGDVTQTEPLPSEARGLSAAGITGPSAGLAIWRRSTLWLCLAMLSVVTILRAASWMEGSFDGMNLPSDVLSVFGKIEALYTLPMFGVVFLVWRAAQSWTQLATSRQAVLRAWLLIFGTPLIMALVPWSMLVEEVRRPQLGLLLSTIFFLTLGPMVIGLCAGLVRGSLITKTLLPQSPWPGWVAVLFGPFYALMLVLVMMFILQAQGSVLLVIGLSALLCAPLIYSRNAKELMRPHSWQEVWTIVNELRRKALICNAIGLGCIGIFALGEMEMGVEDLAEFLINALGGAMLMTVVITDQMIALISKGWEQQKQFEGSALNQELDQALEDLRSGGAVD